MIPVVVVAAEKDVVVTAAPASRGNTSSSLSLSLLLPPSLSSPSWSGEDRGERLRGRVLRRSGAEAEGGCVAIEYETMSTLEVVDVVVLVVATFEKEADVRIDSEARDGDG